MERAHWDGSGQQGGAEPGPRPAVAADVTWIKSSWSAHNGNCVEVAALPATASAASLGAGVGVRDSKDANSPILIFDQREWRQFLARVRTGRHNLP